MKFKHPIPISQIAEFIGAEIIGNTDTFATGINEIHKVQQGDITFVDVEKYFAKSLGSAATFVILNKKIEAPEGKVLLYHTNPFQAYNKLAWHHRPFRPLNTNISDSAEIHESVVIEPNVIIGHQVKIGAGSYIQANTYIGNYTEIGKNCKIQAGTIIGTDAFYYKKDSGVYNKWRTCGKVIIEDNVDIGANCSINRGVSGDTIIGEGSKLDCLIHIGHGAVIGKNCLFAGQVGVAGKTIVGDNVVLYGQVGVAQNLHIGDNVVVLAKSGISKDLAANKVYFGYPAKEVKKSYKELAALRQLPDFMKEINRRFSDR